MTPHLIFTLALLVFTTTGALAQMAPELRSFMESHVPAPNDFHRFLQRDMNAFFSARLKKTVEVEYQLFSDVFSNVPSQPELVLPTYYARVRMTEGGTLVEDGAVIVSAFQRTRFQVMWYVSTAMARKDFGSVTRAFPAEMAKKMYADMNPLDERRDRQDSLCARIPSQKERSERLAGRDLRESSRHGYPEGDPVVWHQKARENGNMRDAWSAIILVKQKDLGRADELWRGYWCEEILPAIATRPDLNLVYLRSAAEQGLPSAMRRLSEVYAEGQFGQVKNSAVAVDWKTKYDAATVPPDKLSQQHLVAVSEAVAEGLRAGRGNGVFGIRNDSRLLPSECKRIFQDLIWLQGVEGIGNGTGNWRTLNEGAILPNLDPRFKGARVSEGTMVDG